MLQGVTKSYSGFLGLPGVLRFYFGVRRGDMGLQGVTVG